MNASPATRVSTAPAEFRTTYPTPDDAVWRVEQAIAALTLIGDGMAIPLDWCGLTDDETQAVRRALAALDAAKMELAGVVTMIRQRTRGTEG